MYDMILLEDKLHFMKYSGGHDFEKKDKLALELHTDRWVMPLPNAWDYEIDDTTANTIIRAKGIEPPFLVEGIDYLHYVASHDSVQSISKEDLFVQAIKNTIEEDIINTACLNGYNTSSQSFNERVLRAAAIILNSARINEEMVFRVPYVLPKQLVYRNDPDYSKIPDFYTISADNCKSIVNAFTVSLQNQIQFDPQIGHLPLYSFTCLISQIQLP